MKLYVWETVLCDYTCGLVVVLANSEEEAWDILYEKDDTVWGELMFDWDVCWDDKDISAMSEKHPEKTLSELRKMWLEKHGIKIYKGAIRPREVTEPDAFYVWGGG